MLLAGKGHRSSVGPVLACAAVFHRPWAHSGGRQGASVVAFRCYSDMGAAHVQVAVRHSDGCRPVGVIVIAVFGPVVVKSEGQRRFSGINDELSLIRVS